jgi:hypothetical protein
VKASDLLLLFLIFLIVILVCVGATRPSAQPSAQGDAEQTSVGAPENQNDAISENNTNQNNVKNESEPEMATNLASIPEAWYIDLPFLHLDNGVTYNGHPSIRLDPDTAPIRERDCIGHWHNLKPGDHVILIVRIKTSSAQNPTHNGDKTYGGGRLGIDFYGGNEVLPPSLPGTVYGYDPYVPFGSDWTERRYDLIIPDTTYDHNYAGQSISPRQIDGCIPWLQVLPLTESGLGWFAETELYINPEPIPPIPPPPAEYYTVIVSAGAGGQATPAGSNQVLVGINFNMHATANTDYIFSYWTRNGTQVKTNANYTITDGTANSIYNMIAYFTYNPPPTPTFTVIISSSTGGSTAPSGTQTSTVGTPVLITATADGGYTFSHWLRNGNVYSTNNPVSISGYTNETITVQTVFEANPPPPPPTPPPVTTYTVNIETATGGSTNYTGVQTVDVGDSLTVQAEPNNNYRFSYWLLDNVNAGANLFITITGTAGSIYNLRPIFQYVAPPPPPEPIPIPPPVIGPLGGTLLPILIGKFEKQKPINFDDLINALKKANL